MDGILDWQQIDWSNKKHWHIKFYDCITNTVQIQFSQSKTSHTFQVWSRLQLDTKNSKIYVLDCENFICTVTVMQYKILICHLLSRWINQVVSWHTWSIFILSPKWPHLIDDWLRVGWRLGRLIGNITNQVLKPFNEHLPSPSFMASILTNYQSFNNFKLLNLISTGSTIDIRMFF